jgi:uncharacterized protein YraI
MNRGYLLLAGIGFGLIVPAASPAQTAYTGKTVNLRAGPSREYPLVARLPAGTPVEVNGCVDDWTWCDVSFGFDRGWVYAGNLEYPYQDRRVVILYDGPILGFPIVTFSVGPYWDTYYHARPWYSRRDYWAHRKPPPHHWNRPPGSHPPGYRPPAPRPPPPVARPPVERPQPRPQPFRPQPQQPRPQPQQPSRPEAAKPQPQPARPAPVKPPENKPAPPRPVERKPGGN